MVAYCLQMPNRISWSENPHFSICATRGPRTGVNRACRTFSDRTTFSLCWRRDSLNSDPVRGPHNRKYESAVANVFVCRSRSHPMKFNAINALYRECFKFGAAVPRVISVGTPKGRLTDVLRRYRA